MILYIFILSPGDSWWKPKFNVYSSNLEDEKNLQWLLRRIISLGLEFGVYYEFGLPGDLKSPKQPRTFTSEIYVEWGLIIWILLYLKLSYKTLPKALRTQALTALGRLGWLGLFWQVWFGEFGLVGLIWWFWFGSLGFTYFAFKKMYFAYFTLHFAYFST